MFKLRFFESSDFNGTVPEVCVVILVKVLNTCLDFLEERRLKRKSMQFLVFHFWRIQNWIFTANLLFFPPWQSFDLSYHNNSEIPFGFGQWWLKINSIFVLKNEGKIKKKKVSLIKRKYIWLCWKERFLRREKRIDIF